MLRCEVGDLSGKHERLNIGSGRQFYTDPNLPLFGEWSGKDQDLLSFKIAKTVLISSNKRKSIKNVFDVYFSSCWPRNCSSCREQWIWSSCLCHHQTS